MNGPSRPFVRSFVRSLSLFVRFRRAPLVEPAKAIAREGPRPHAARRPARAGAHPGRHAHHADAAPLRRARRGVGPRAAALDFLVALGTHAPDERRAAVAARRARGRERPAGARQVFNHRWDDPASFATLGTIPAAEIEQLSGGRLSRDVTVALNKLPLEYDHVLVCGPVFPHEVVGFSGGTKYLLPGIAGPEIINFTHWLGALMTNYDIIGTKTTPGARRDRPRREPPRPAALAPRPGGDARGRGGPLLRPRPRGLVGGGRPLVEAAHRLARQAGEARPLGHARDVRRPVDRRQGHVQDGAGGGGRWRGGHLRPAHHRGEPHPRQAHR